MFLLMVRVWEIGWYPEDRSRRTGPVGWARFFSHRLDSLCTTTKPTCSTLVLVLFSEVFRIYKKSLKPADSLFNIYLARPLAAFVVTVLARTRFRLTR